MGTFTILCRRLPHEFLEPANKIIGVPISHHCCNFVYSLICSAQQPRGLLYSQLIQIITEADRVMLFENLSQICAVHIELLSQQLQADILSVMLVNEGLNLG
ncbi:hypothetical protein D3C74_444320 [compost metagenome]